MKSLENTVKDVERDLVINITLSLRRQRISRKEARDLAREFMRAQPFKNKNDLFKKLCEMSDKYKEVRKIYLKYVLEYEAEKDKKILKLIREFMKQDEIDAAIRVAKGGE